MLPPPLLAGCVPEDAVSPTRSGGVGVGDGVGDGDKWWLQIQSLAPLCRHHHRHHHSGAGHQTHSEIGGLVIIY